MSVSQIVLFSCGSKEHCKARNELMMEDYDTLTSNVKLKVLKRKMKNAYLYIYIFLYIHYLQEFVQIFMTKLFFE